MARHYELKPMPDYGTIPTTAESCLWPLHKWGLKLVSVDGRYGYECDVCACFVAMPTYKYKLADAQEEPGDEQRPA